MDYTAGCDAPTANWKAEEHWSRIRKQVSVLSISAAANHLLVCPHVVTLASAFHGGLEGADQFVKSNQVRSAISSAMGFWFSNDFSNIACLDQGGEAACACGTSGLWNRNWFSNVRLFAFLHKA